MINKRQRTVYGSDMFVQTEQPAETSPRYTRATRQYFDNAETRRLARLTEFESETFPEFLRETAAAGFTDEQTILNLLAYCSTRGLKMWRQGYDRQADEHHWGYSAVWCKPGFTILEVAERIIDYMVWSFDSTDEYKSGMLSYEFIARMLFNNCHQYRS